MSTSAKLTEEQRRKIEENRRKALEKRAAARLQNQQGDSSKNIPAPQKQMRSFPHKAAPQTISPECAKPCQTSSNQENGPNDRNMKEFLSKFSRPGSSRNTYKNKELSSSDEILSSTNYKNQQNNPLKNHLCDSSSSSDPPAYGGYKSELSKGGPTKSVKGTCVLLSQTRFAVKVKFHGPLIGIFKTIPSRSYGMCTIYHEGFGKHEISKDGFG